MKRIILFIFIMSLFSCSMRNKAQVASLEVSDSVQMAMEYAYFEGQRDYSDGDIRISKTGGYYIWVESPWDSGKLPLWNPRDGDL